MQVDPREKVSSKISKYTIVDKCTEDHEVALANTHFDKKFAEMVSTIKPNVPYYQESLGDKMLHIQRVDQLDYDIVKEEVERLRAER